MDRVKWAFLLIVLGILWVFKIMDFLPEDFWSIFFHQKFLFPTLIIILGLYLFLRDKYPRFAQWLIWLCLFLIGLWLVSSTYNEKTWV